jgi:tRNA (cmo5U34)-methyltransferase
MNLELVKQHFEGDADTYESHILKFVPFYREQNEMMMEMLPFERTSGIKAVDLGAGPGVLSEMLLRRFPRSKVLVFDLAEKMIALARENLSRFEDRVEYQLGNLATDDFGGGYDLVISGLSIHHLDHETKRSLFHRIYAALKSGGLFLNRDVVSGATERLSGMYVNLWRLYVRSMGEDDASMMKRYYAEDIPASVEEQLEWMREAGFIDVGCHWQRLNFAIYGGRKP